MSLQHTRTQYTFSTLTKKTLKNLPEEQLQMWLDEAQQAKIRDYNACCIATANPQGMVGARYVLLRHLDGEGLVFYSNRNSEKGRHISQNPQGQMLFFWREFNRQVRTSGEIVELDRDTVDRYFQSRPLGNQKATAASEQSQPIDSRDTLERKFNLLSAQYPGYVPTPEKWAGYRLRPSYWEFWQGRPNRLHDRLCYHWDNASSTWRIQRLQP